MAGILQVSDFGIRAEVDVHGDDVKRSDQLHSSFDGERGVEEETGSCDWLLNLEWGLSFVYWCWRGLPVDEGVKCVPFQQDDQWFRVYYRRISDGHAGNVMFDVSARLDVLSSLNYDLVQIHIAHYFNLRRKHCLHLSIGKTGVA